MSGGLKGYPFPLKISKEDPPKKFLELFLPKINLGEIAKF
jgi:hypothetical protein